MVNINYTNQYKLIIILKIIKFFINKVIIIHNKQNIKKKVLRLTNLNKKLFINNKSNLKIMKKIEKE